MGERGFDPGERLATLEDRGLRRSLDPADRVGPRARFAVDPRGDAPVFDGDAALVFAANNYLGLADHPRVVAAARAAADEVGTGAGASRLVTGDLPPHRALERDLAACKGAERALVFSSGYAANVGTIDALAPDVVFSDELNHASIVDGCRLSGAETVVYDHCDPDALRSAMTDRADEPDASSDGAAPSWLVVTDTVFSMDGDVAPLAALCDVAAEFGAWVMVDEAHATGLYGPSGGGVVQREGLGEQVDVQLGTLSKALAAQGGYVAGDAALIEYLANAARTFVFSTGLAPPAATAAREALAVARASDRRDRLWTAVERLREGLTGMGYEVLGESQILPVLVGDREDAMALDAALRDRGIVAPAIRPPTVPDGTARIRVAPMATHDADDVDACLAAFRAAGEEEGLL
ncbi:MAG: aminotransferase class I/II-fold pyridoxal phosphate-dependent enzyme [Haloarculaceae archaeon]